MRTSVLPEGVQLTGQIRGSGDLVVRGVLIGNVDLDGLLTIEAGGLLRGEVRARSMIVRGLVEGPVVTLELLRLESGARVVGDVQADRVSAASGAVIRGRVRMTGADRLRRTAGGTLTAPFTSSGAVEAPRVEAHKDVKTTLDPARLASLGQASLSESASFVPIAPVHPPREHGIRDRTTEAPEERTSILRQDLRSRVTESPDLHRRQAKVRAPLPVASPVPVVPRVERAPVPSEAAPRGQSMVVAAPPPPVIPRIGRVKSRRREDAP